MKCFIHLGAEAIAVCRDCGKGMCANCSAYSGHSGICPECRKKGFIQERNRIMQEVKECKFAIVGWALLSALIIPIPVTTIKIICRALDIKSYNKRIATLTTEIDRLEKVLSNRGGAEFF